MLEGSWLVSLSWTDHVAGEAFNDFSLTAPEVTDGSFYLRDRPGFENADLDLLHDVELLGRALEKSIQTRIDQCGLSWDKVVIIGFGKGAGIALYAALLKVIQKPIAGMILFSPVVLFPTFLGEKLAEHADRKATAPLKVFAVWGGRNRSTPGTYRQLLQQTLRKVDDVKLTPDTIQDGVHQFDSKSMTIMNSFYPMLLRP